MSTMIPVQDRLQTYWANIVNGRKNQDSTALLCRFLKVLKVWQEIYYIRLIFYLLRKHICHCCNRPGAQSSMCGQLPDTQPGGGWPSRGSTGHAPGGRLRGKIFCQIHASLSRAYRSRHYYESKVLHNTEVTWFSTFRHSPKTDFFLSKLQKKVIALFIALLLAPSKPKLVDCTVQ